MNKTKKFLLLLRRLQPVFAHKRDLDLLKKNVSRINKNNKLLSTRHNLVKSNKSKLAIKTILRLKMYWIEIKQALLSVPEEISIELSQRDR